jgi:hypothetical protein
MANKPQAVQAAQSAIPGVNEAPVAEAPILSPAELETIEQLGRDYWMAEDAKTVAERKLSQCDTALFDFLKGVDYKRFMAVRAAYITGCRDKGAPNDEAAERTFQRAVNRLGNSFGYEKPKAESEAAKKMAAKRAALQALYESKSDEQLATEKNQWTSMGDPTSLKKAAEIAKEQERRAKPVLDAEESARKAILDKLVTRAKELAKARTADADDKLIRALQMMMS